MFFLFILSENVFILKIFSSYPLFCWLHTLLISVCHFYFSADITTHQTGIIGLKVSMSSVTDCYLSLFLLVSLLLF